MWIQQPSCCSFVASRCSLRPGAGAAGAHRTTVNVETADRRRTQSGWTLALRRQDARPVARLQAAGGARRLAGGRRRARARRRRRRPRDDGQFENFELALEWQIAPGGNSGVMYRVTEDARRRYHTGPEFQVLDNAGTRDGKIPADLGRLELRPVRAAQGRRRNRSASGTPTRLVVATAITSSTG